MAKFSGWRLTRAGFVFIIVIILLAVAVFAGVRFVQQRGEQVRQDEATQVARDTQAASQTPAIAEETPATQSEDEAEAAPSTATESQVAQAVPDALPQTGIDSVLPMLLLAAATYGTAWIVRERRSLRANVRQG